MKQDKQGEIFTSGEVDKIKKAKLRVALVVADFYKNIIDELTAGAVAALAPCGITADSFFLSGALEIPPAIARLDNKYNIYIALGAVVRGETSHYDIVADLSARGLMELGINKKIIIGNGILTTDTMDQAEARADRKNGNKGGFAAMAALRLWLVTGDNK